VRGRSLLGIALAATLVGCGTATPTPSVSLPPGGACGSDLPARTSPIDVPVGVLWVNGEDLPPVIGDVDWQPEGGGEPVEYRPPRAVHLDRFTVVQTQGLAEVSLRMTDGVQIGSWTVDVVPDSTFRSGSYEAGRTRWAEGGEPTEVACIPIQNGSWAVIADITFADDAGSGTYYWRLVVTEVPGS
jgi:hypothetical protein